jgi:hypothetical protein
MVARADDGGGVHVCVGLTSSNHTDGDGLS